MTELLPADLQQYVHDALADGRYQDEAQLMTQAVRLLREQENFERVRAQVQNGIAQIERGEYDEVEIGKFGEYFAEIIAEVDRENAQRKNKIS